MTRPLHRGRPGSRVLPAGWQAQVAPTAARTIRDTGCTVTIRPPGGGPTYSTDLGRTVVTPQPAIYTGPADVSAVSAADQVVEAALQEQATRTYAVQLPLDEPGSDLVERGHVVTIDTNPDPGLVGKSMSVESIAWSTRLMSRVLYATLNT